MDEPVTDKPDALSSALEYLDLGLSVIPLCPAFHVGVGKAHRGCGSPGKRPFFPNRQNGSQGDWKEFQSRRATPDEVKEWFDANPYLNLGVALGPVSNLVGIDIDDEEGEELLREFNGGDEVPTWEYTTGKGRRLLYFLPEGQSVCTTPFRRPGTEIEILRLMAAGSQVVLPPSIHPNGARYRWVEGKSPSDIPLAVIPTWWAEKKAEPKKTQAPGDAELIGEGGRDNYLTTLAGSMRRNGAHEEVIYVALEKMNADRCNPPLDESQVRKIARSVARYAPDEFTAVTIKLPGGAPLPEPVATGDRRFKWASELSAPHKTDEWIWNGYLPKSGMILLSALWKAGKTTLLSHLLRALSSDGTFLGREVKAAKVLYVSEEGEQHWVRRRDTMGLRDNAGFYLQPFKVRPVPSEWREFVAQLAKDVKEYEFDLVVFDTLAKLWPVREENDAGDVDDALMPLWDVTKAGAGVLMIHHLRKSGGSEYTGSRGSGALSAFPDIVIELTRFDATDVKSRKRALRAKGRYEETPDELVIELVDGEYRALDAAQYAPVTTVHGESEEEKVVKVMKETTDAWVTVDYLREQLRVRGLGIRDADVKTHLKSLESRGEVVAVGVFRSKTNPQKFSLASRAAPGKESGQEILAGDKAA